MAKYPARALVLSAGDTPEQVGQVTEMGEPGSSRELIDASAYGDDWMDYVVGQQDGEEIDLVIAYDPEDTGHAGLVATYEEGGEETFWMSHAASGFSVTFPGIMTKLTRGGPRDGLLAMNLTVKILSPGVSDVEESS